MECSSKAVDPARKNSQVLAHVLGKANFTMDRIPEQALEFAIYL